VNMNLYKTKICIKQKIKGLNKCIVRHDTLKSITVHTNTCALRRLLSITHEMNTLQSHGTIFRKRKPCFNGSIGVKVEVNHCWKAHVDVFML
jgi:hypothetical protein